MNKHLAAAALLAVAGAVYASAALPMRREAATIADELRRLRAQRRDVRSKLVTLERRTSVQRRAASALAGLEPVRGGTLASTRRAILAALDEAAVSGVRLEVRPAAAPLAAAVHLSATGSAAEIVRLTGRLTQAGTGIVLSQVRLTPSAGRLMLDLEAVRPGESP
jgi:hypothetical protein